MLVLMFVNFNTGILPHLSDGIEKEQNGYRQEDQEPDACLLFDALQEAGLEERSPSLRTGNGKDQEQQCDW